jgi:hypothetical protein
MRVLIRAVVEGFLGLGIVAVALLLHLARRIVSRRQDRLHSSSAPMHNNSAFGRNEKLRRPFFLSRSDEL